MSTFAKIFLLVGLIFVLGAASCAGLASYAVKDTRAILLDAQAFGVTHDQYECESASFDKVEECSGTICMVKVAGWHSICLTEATPNHGYCDDVPNPNHAVASEAWYGEACAKVQMPDDDSCRVILGATQALCHQTEWTTERGGVTVSLNP